MGHIQQLGNVLCKKKGQDLLPLTPDPQSAVIVYPLQALSS